eukprot:6938927-Prymnesium_polylepis.1
MITNNQSTSSRCRRPWCLRRPASLTLSSVDSWSSTSCCINPVIAPRRDPRAPTASHPGSGAAIPTLTGAALSLCHTDSAIPHEATMPTRGMIMCAAGGINGLAAPTAMARLLRESFQLMWPLELYFTQGEASHPRFGSVVGNWTASLRSEGMAVSVHELHESAVGNRYECKLLALLETGLDEVLFCGSDLALLRSPEILFLSEEYRRNGA